MRQSERLEKAAVVMDAKASANREAKVSECQDLRHSPALIGGKCIGASAAMTGQAASSAWPLPVPHRREPRSLRVLDDRTPAAGFVARPGRALTLTRQPESPPVLARILNLAANWAEARFQAMAGGRRLSRASSSEANATPPPTPDDEHSETRVRGIFARSAGSVPGTG